MTISEWVKRFYACKLKNGWRMADIDALPVKRYMDILNFEQEKEYWENQKKAIAMLKGCM